MTTLLAIDNATVNTTDTTDNTPKIKIGPLTRKVKAEHKHVDESTQRKEDILHATDAEQGKLDAYRDAENDVVNTIVATIDPKDALKKYCKAGKQTHALAIRRLESLAAGAWNGRKDFDKVCDDVATLVKMRVAVKDVRPSTYVRVYLWCRRCAFHRAERRQAQLQHDREQALAYARIRSDDVDGRNPQGMVDVRSDDSRASIVSIRR